MYQKLTYQHELVKGDLIEIYAKTIANLSIFNFLREKTFSCSTTGNPHGGGQVGSTQAGYLRGLHAYVARGIMDAEGDVISATMKYCSPFGNAVLRKVSLKSVEGTTQVELEGSERGVKKMKRTINQMFVRSPEELVSIKRIVDIIKG